MRIVLCGLVLASALLAACVARKAAPNSSSIQGSTNSTTAKLIVTPELGLIGRVVAVNLSSRFVVLNFPVGYLPALEQRLHLYRQGLKVGEVKVTGPQQDDNIVADLVVGESQVGDEAREN